MLAAVTEGYRLDAQLLALLHPHQLVGVRWLLNNYDLKRGSLLADEMGLGKTVQTIGFVGALIDSAHGLTGERLDALIREAVDKVCRKDDDEPPPNYSAAHYAAFAADPTPSFGRTVRDHVRRQLMREVSLKIIVVCPATLVAQWLQEISRFYPLLGFLTTSASPKENGIVLTTYEYLRRHQATFRKSTFDVAILDEGHKLKNPNAQLTLALKSLNLTHRVLLSGTPLQNDLGEFWSLMDFIQPGVLGTLPTFRKYFVAPIEKAGKHVISESDRERSRESILVLKQLVLPHLLRRTSAQVQLALPEKEEKIVMCPLTLIQYEIYSAFLTIHKVAEKMAQSQWQRDAKRRFTGSHALAYLTMLIKICNHPDITIRTVHRPPDYGSVERSGKLKITLKLLETWRAQKNRVLVFSQRVRTLDILQLHLTAMDQVDPGAYRFLRLDGSVPVRNRIPIVDQFNADPSVFCMLLTTRVGGVGINLTAADRVLIYDPDWNPTVDAQAQQRCWRIGQANSDVKIFRLVCEGTVEEKIYRRQIFKSHIAQRLLADTDNKAFKPNDFIELFGFPPRPKAEGEAVDRDVLRLFTEAFKRPDIFKAAAEEEEEIQGVAPHEPLLSPGDKQGLDESAVSGSDISNRMSTPEKPSSAKRRRVANSLLLPGESSSEEDAEEEEGELTPDESPAAVEDELLDSLCSSGAISSIEDHERLVCESEVVKIESDNRKRYAYIAYEAVTLSRRLRDAHSWNVPTWTGRHGAAGKPLALQLAHVARSLREQNIENALEKGLLPSGLTEQHKRVFCRLVEFMYQRRDVEGREVELEFQPYIDKAERPLLQSWLARIALVNVNKCWNMRFEYRDRLKPVFDSPKAPDHPPESAAEASSEWL